MSSKAERERKKLEQDKLQSILNQLLREEDNKYCADCDAKGPRWASWNLGLFLCIRCAGIHRNLGVHISKVKSVNLDTWSPQQTAYMMVLGNSAARGVYEANIPENFRRPQSDSALEAFIRAKYDQKRYILKDWIPPKIDPKNYPGLDTELSADNRKKSGDGGHKSSRSARATNQPPPPSLIAPPPAEAVGNSSLGKSSCHDIVASSSSSGKAKQQDSASNDLLDLSVPTVVEPAGNRSTHAASSMVNSSSGGGSLGDIMGLNIGGGGGDAGSPGESSNHHGHSGNMMNCLALSQPPVGGSQPNLSMAGQNGGLDHLSKPSASVNKQPTVAEQDINLLQTDSGVGAAGSGGSVKSKTDILALYGSSSSLNSSSTNTAPPMMGGVGPMQQGVYHNGAPVGMGGFNPFNGSAGGLGQMDPGSVGMQGGMYQQPQRNSMMGAVVPGGGSNGGLMGMFPVGGVGTFPNSGIMYQNQSSGSTPAMFGSVFNSGQQQPQQSYFPYGSGMGGGSALNSINGTSGMGGIGNSGVGMGGGFAQVNNNNIGGKTGLVAGGNAQSPLGSLAPMTQAKPTNSLNSIQADFASFGLSGSQAGTTTLSTDLWQ